MGIFIDPNLLQRISNGNKWNILGRIAWTSPYVSGGEEILPATVALSQINLFTITGQEKGFLFEYDYLNQKLKVFQGGGSGGGSFAGNALPGHSHVFTGNLLPIHAHSHIMSLVVQNISTIRLYMSLASIVGVFQVGEVVTGSVSGDTATVVSTAILGSARYLVVSGPTGNFSTLDTITGGTSGATGTALRTLLNNWAISPTFGDDAIITACTPNTFVGLTQMASNIAPAFTNTFRATGELILPAVETLRSDGFTQVSVSGAVETTSAASGGTPTGSNSSVSAGTPSGSISGGGGLAASEVPNGTDLSILDGVEFEAIGL